MKKITGFSLLTILVLYLVLLSKYLLIEEIIGLYFVPIALIVFATTLRYLIIRVTRSINYKITIIKSLLVSCILQIMILGFILWSASTRYFSNQKVIGDIDYAVKVMEDVHPNLYNAISKEDFYLRTDSIKQTLPEKVSDIEAYKALRNIFSLLKDGHTGGSVSFIYKRGANVFRKTLPYKIEIENERLFVIRNYSYANIIPIGSEIIKINGKPASQCLQEVSKLISYENIPYRNSLLQTPTFWSLWNNYKSFEITYKEPGSKFDKTIKTSGGFLSKWMFFRDNKPKETNFSYKILSNNIGYIEFNSFQNLNKFKIFLDSTFRSLKNNNIENLIIDIRKNGGGNSSLGDELMQYISPTDFSVSDSAFVKISHEIIQNGMLNWLDPSHQKIDSIYKFLTGEKIKLRENPNRFTGNTYLLIGGYTFSSASNFASSFQCYQMGKIIGTETGGLTVCYGDVYRFNVPNTKINMRVSYKKFFNACGVDDKRGVLPDYIVENTFEDEQKGIDRVLAFTIDLIKQNK